MTVNNVLHALWTNSISKDKLEKREEKRLWMVLQQFVERNGGVSASAKDYDVSMFATPLSQDGRPTRSVGRISRACNRVRALLRFQT